MVGNQSLLFGVRLGPVFVSAAMSNTSLAHNNMVEVVKSCRVFDGVAIRGSTMKRTSVVTWLPNFVPRDDQSFQKGETHELFAVASQGV
jgi:hypothetical protein